MDKRDLQLLRMLGENCRLSYATLAKALNVSKDTVKNRMRALEEKKVITHYNTIIDLRTFGFVKFQIFVKLKNALQNRDDVIERLKKHKSLSFVNTFIGKYDLHVIVDTRDIYSFDRIKSDIFSIFGDEVRDYTILTFYSDLRHTHLIPETSLDIKFDRKNDSSFSSSFSKSFELEEDFSLFKVDSMDFKILRILAEKPRISLVDMSEKLKLNREAVKQRIIKLINGKVIKSFGANVSFEAFDYVTYFLMIKTNREIEDKQLREKFRGITNVYYSAKVHGDYSLITYVLAKTPKELKESIRKMRNVLENEILEMEVMIFDELVVYKQFPENVLKELEAK